MDKNNKNTEAFFTASFWLRDVCGWWGHVLGGRAARTAPTATTTNTATTANPQTVRAIDCPNRAHFACV